MPASISAIVFKTAKLEATRYFFETVLRLCVKERSARHFVVHTKGMRLVFIQSGKGFETVFYVNDMPNQHRGPVKLDLTGASFERHEDPNGISVIRVQQLNTPQSKP